MKRGEKMPEDHRRCPRCERPYSFVGCRLAYPDGTSKCLDCAVEERKKKNLSTQSTQLST